MLGATNCALARVDAEHIPLSENRLQSKGLYGCLVRSAQHADGSTHIRHLHPNEAMCLNSMDPVLDFW